MRLPFNAVAYGYRRGEMIGFVLSDLHRLHDATGPIRPFRRSEPGFWHRWSYTDRRVTNARRTARRFLTGQIKAHERALEKLT